MTESKDYISGINPIDIKEARDELPLSTSERVVKYLRTVKDYDSKIWCTKSSLLCGVGGREATLSKVLLKMVSDGVVEERVHNNRKGYRLVE